VARRRVWRRDEFGGGIGFVFYPDDVGVAEAVVVAGAEIVEAARAGEVVQAGDVCGDLLAGGGRAERAQCRDDDLGRVP